MKAVRVRSSRRDNSSITRHPARIKNAYIRYCPRTAWDRQSRDPFDDARICCAAGDIVSQSRSASTSPLKYERTLAAAPPIIRNSETLRSLPPQIDTKPVRSREIRIAASETESPAVPEVSSPLGKW